jgi:hypothetical protein
MNRSPAPTIPKKMIVVRILLGPSSLGRDGAVAPIGACAARSVIRASNMDRTSQQSEL